MGDGVLILAPRGRDAAVAADLLRRHGIACVACDDLAVFAERLGEGADAALLAEEALVEDGLEAVMAWLTAQPTWSDFPFVVLANGQTRARSGRANHTLDALGNAVLLQRPLHADAMVRAVRSAIAARGRQYEARERIEALHASEASFRESEAKFHAITDSVDQMIWSTLPDGFHDFYNRRWYDFTGVPPGSTDGEAWNGMFHPDDRERAWARWRHCLATGEPYEIEYRLRHRSGEYRWVLGRAQAVRDPDGAITRWYGSCTEIGDQVRAREALARSREVLEAAVRARTAELAELYAKTPVVLHSIGPDTRLLSVSDRWLAFMGCDDREDVIGRAITEFMTPESAREFEDRDWPELLRDGSSEDGPTCYVKRSGETADVLVSARVERDADGRVVRAMASVIDVTDRLRAEAERDEAEEALRHAQRMETIGQLTGGVSHDFNNLLTPIVGSLDMLRRRHGDDEKSQRLIGGALQAAERAATLTQRLLSFARRQTLQPRSVDVGALVEGMLDLVTRSLGPTIRVAVRIEGEPPPAMVDPNQLELAILNLGVNARDAMPDGGALAIEVAPHDVRGGSGELADGRYVRVGVIDTGTGMDADTLKRCVEPFYSTKGVGKGKGTGLGLSMAHGLAAQSGGVLSLRSEPGLGTRAELFLPAADAAVAAPSPSAAMIPALRRAAVLLVDDEDLVRTGTADMLADLGHTVVEAASGAQALAALRGGVEVDLVVTDYLMPGMTGAALIRELRASWPRMPVLLATGFANTAADVPGDVPKLAKPFRQADLSMRVNHLLARYADAPGERAPPQLRTVE
ncbi:PAS domain-containing protein [uncultured Sphingomonas sp.]|uniref:hybrid sensor histidine kinase/response regulator n=1 Tax=uncultured Sphingomonas sp. TaxID=158754 RepID=UPI0035C98588